MIHPLHMTAGGSRMTQTFDRNSLLPSKTIDSALSPAVGAHLCGNASMRSMSTKTLRTATQLANQDKFRSALKVPMHRGKVRPALIAKERFVDATSQQPTEEAPAPKPAGKAIGFQGIRGCSDAACKRLDSW